MLLVATILVTSMPVFAKGGTYHVRSYTKKGSSTHYVRSYALLRKVVNSYRGIGLVAIGQVYIAARTFVINHSSL